MQTEKIRDLLDRALTKGPVGAPAWQTAALRNDEWKTLIEEGFVDDIAAGEPEGLQRALTYLRTDLRRPPPLSGKRPRRPRMSPTLRQHQKAMSEVLAARAD